MEQAPFPRFLIDHAGQKGIGDIVCEVAFYEALRRLHPTAHIASRASRTLAWGHPAVDAFDETSPDEAFDRVIRLGDVALHATGLPEARAQGKSVFDYVRGLAGFAPEGTAPRLYVTTSEFAALPLEEDDDEGLVVAFSVDAVDARRRWGAERFSALMRHLERAHGVSLVEVGAGLNEGHLGLGFDMVGRTTLRQTMGLLQLADLFVGNHGGLTHLAGALRTPVLCPWGASHLYGAYAYDSRSVAVESRPPCRNCAWTGMEIEECRGADVVRGRSPCTQAITVTHMVEAADALIPKLRSERAQLRAAKTAARDRAREPEGLVLFDRPSGFHAPSHAQLYLGGLDPSWGEAHSADGFRRLRQLVAFPDWLGRPEHWKALLKEYLDSFPPGSPWVLVLSAEPLAGPEVLALLEGFLLGELGLRGPFAKVLLLLGALTDEERAALRAQAEADLSLA